MDYETIRTSTHAKVVATGFTRVVGQPTFEQKENFLAEAEALAINFVVSYIWAGEHGLLAEIMGAAKYLAKTGEVYVAPVRPPIADPRILGGGLSQAAIRVAAAVNDTAKIDFAVVEGFRSGFGVIFRQAFDLTYYEQLWEETFIYKRVLPTTYITHLETRHVILDTVVVKRLKANYYRGWDVAEHINSFGVRLNREQRKLSQYAPPIVISNADKVQHYLEQMWTRTDIFDEKFMTAWTARTIAQKTFDLARAYFEAKVKAIADFKAAGGQVNSYATANAATEIKSRHQRARRVRREQRRLQQGKCDGRERGKRSKGAARYAAERSSAPGKIHEPARRRLT